MCDYDNAPQAYQETCRKARKRHYCYECRNEIAAGTHYWVASGVWDGSGASYKLCAVCKALHSFFHAAHDVDPAFEDVCPPTFGDLEAYVDLYGKMLPPLFGLRDATQELRQRRGWPAYALESAAARGA
jgi:hypothetical protein